MSGRKNVLRSFKMLDAEDMHQDFVVSTPVDINYLDNIGIQVSYDALASLIYWGIRWTATEDANNDVSIVTLIDVSGGNEYVEVSGHTITIHGSFVGSTTSVIYALLAASEDVLALVTLEVLSDEEVDEENTQTLGETTGTLAVEVTNSAVGDPNETWSALEFTPTIPGISGGTANIVIYRQQLPYARLRLRFTRVNAYGGGPITAILEAKEI